ncbi:hypothetical protein B0H11DRAFT_2248409 [Mycena galericulata]|nr:hypothetical protein B0H11DRAFT_2248409 [Mycena galericulata]
MKSILPRGYEKETEDISDYIQAPDNLKIAKCGNVPFRKEPAGWLAKDFKFRRNKTVLRQIRDNGSLSGNYCGGSPSNIAPDANLFLHKDIAYPKVTDEYGGLEILDWENYAIFYDPVHHWFGFNPADKLKPLVGTIDDPVGFAFDQTPVRIGELYNDVQRAGGSDDV